MKNTFKVRVKIWIYPGQASWHFVTIPQKQSRIIDNLYGDLKRGFGSLPVNVTIGKTTWQTSIFPDKKTMTYLLPIKSQVRKIEKIQAGQTMALSFTVKD
jgi:hypothetical protein